MAVAQRGVVSLDCAEPRSLGEFWAAMLDGEIVISKPSVVVVRSDWVLLAALHVPGYRPPTWPSNEIPKQMHLDLAVTDLDVAVAEAQELGAVVASEQPGGDEWRVLFDPAGHPFCLTTQISPDWA
jgi:hypothetical protein